MTRHHTVWTLRAFYLFYYASLGTMLPYLSLLFAARGLSTVVIGGLLAINPLAGAIIPPIWGRFADRSGRTVRLLRWQVAMLPILVFLLFMAHTTMVVLIVLILLAIFLSAVAPLADHLTLEHASHMQIDYGRVRVFGSIGFSAANIVVMLFLRFNSVNHLDWLYIPIVFCVFVLTWRLQDAKSSLSLAENAPLKNTSESRSAQKLSSLRSLTIFYIATFIAALTVSIYTPFFPLFARGVGLPETLVPLAFTLSSGSELLTMPYASKIYRRIGPMSMLALATLAYAIRWTVVGVSGAAWPTLVIQITHGISFGLWYTGTVMYLRDAVPKRFRATGQTLFAATNGTGSVLGTSVGGAMFSALSPRGFFIAEAGIALLASTVYMLMRWRKSKHLNVITKNYKCSK